MVIDKLNAASLYTVVVEARKLQSYDQLDEESELCSIHFKFIATMISTEKVN